MWKRVKLGKTCREACAASEEEDGDLDSSGGDRVGAGRGRRKDLREDNDADA